MFTIHSSQTPIESVRLAQLPLRGPLEQLVSSYLSRPWAIHYAWDMAEFASHPSAVLSDGQYAVFAKLSEAANGAEQLNLELAGLGLLAERAGVLTPTPIGVVPVTGGALLVFEAIQAVARGPQQWRQIGQTLARIHKVKGTQFGLETHGYFGPLYQPNTPAADWPTFYAERRLWPGLQMAMEAGHMPHDVIRQIETLITRVPQLCGPTVEPTLLHGDAQQNNFISTEAGAVVIDPAVYYGHPEMDLAYIDYFQPVPADVLDGYRDELPIDPDFNERRDLWRIWGYLAAVTVESAAYLKPLTEAVSKYL